MRLRRSGHIKVLCFLTMIPILTTLSVISSWYGPGFDGRLTASGSRYNQNGLTAAHKTLPFGTKLKVCFKRCAVVRVNDRGFTFMVGDLISVKVRLMQSDCSCVPESTYCGNAPLEGG